MLGQRLVVRRPEQEALRRLRSVTSLNYISIRARFSPYVGRVKLLLPFEFVKDVSVYRSTSSSGSGGGSGGGGGGGGGRGSGGGGGGSGNSSRDFITIMIIIMIIINTIIISIIIIHCTHFLSSHRLRAYS